MTARLVVLLSGAGSNAADLLDRLATNPDTPAHVVAVGSDVDAPGLKLAQARGIPVFMEPLASGEDREIWGERLIQRIDSYSPDLVILSGFMRLLPANVVEHYSPRLWNTHPAYLPEFPGAHAVADAMEAGASQTGASVILVDTGVDTGPIIARERVAIEPGDTQESLHEKIKAVERRLLFDLVQRFCRGEEFVDLREKVNESD